MSLLEDRRTLKCFENKGNVDYLLVAGYSSSMICRFQLIELNQRLL